MAHSIHPQILLLLVFVCEHISSSVHKIIYNEFNTEKLNSGYFVSPNWPEKYPQDVRYFYIFVGTNNHQVQLTFDHFNIEGLSHSCDKDYLDIYVEIKTETGIVNISEDLFQEPLLGRFCGHNLEYIPNTVVSKHNVIILDFFSDTNTQQSYNQDDHMGQLGFKGNYTFKLNELYFKFLTSSNQYPCYYMIHNNLSQSGHVQSPTYPGLLPSPLNCIYEFRSNNPNHRIELIFDNFNLFQQDNMCPVEYIEIFDEEKIHGKSKSIFGRLCGQRNSNRFVSSRNRMYMRLVVLAGRDYMKEPHNIDLYKKSLQNSGFKISFHFSEYFASVNKLSNNFNRIKGTECDIKIQSDGQSSGTLASHGMDGVKVKGPTICNYYFFGIHNSQNMETVQLDFSYFYIPTLETNKCSFGFLSMYSAQFQMNDIIKRRRSVVIRTDPDRILCGDIQVPFLHKSIDPVFILKLNISQIKSERAIGFKLSFRFLKDFGISGHMISQGECHYRYESQLNGVKGIINSPFYKSFYPNNSTCRYDLLAKMNETVRIVFKMFQTSEDVSPKLVTYHEVHLSCRQDYLSVSEIIRTGSGFLRTNNTERYCGTSIPGLLVSQPNSIGFTLVFQSDSVKNGPGFLAKYEFLKKAPVFTERCGGNVSTINLFGLISSPNFPQRYPPGLICEWHLHSFRQTERLLLLFTQFQIEGTAKSCSNSVVRIYEGNNVQPQSELCGTDSAIPAYESKSNFVRVRFLTDESSKGAKGFKLIWTQIIPMLQNGSCQGFKCIHSGHCINISLTCNKIINCGSYSSQEGSTLIDDSDETQACPIERNNSYLYSGLGMVASILFTLIIVVFYLIHKNKYLLKTQFKLGVSINDLVQQQFSTPSHSLIKEIATSSASGSLGLVHKRELTTSSDGIIQPNDLSLNYHRQFSFDLGTPLTRANEMDNVDALSECGFFYREQMQKISIV